MLDGPDIDFPKAERWPRPRLADDDVPGFLYGRDGDAGDLRRILADPTNPEHACTLAMLLIEARPDEVWDIVTPEVVADAWDEVEDRLGERRAFWQWLLSQWRALDLLP